MTVRLLVPAYGKQTNALYTGTQAAERTLIDTGQADNNLSASFDYADYLAGKSMAPAVAFTQPAVDAATAAGVVFADGVARGALSRFGAAPSRTDVEDAFVAAIGLRPPAVRPTIVETTPTTATTTRYYIDPIAGANTRDGLTAATAFADLWKIGGVKAAGTTYYVAADSIFEYAQTWTDYKAAPLFVSNNIGQFSGTAAAPITIRPYSPRPTIQSKPIIRWYALMQASDWTLEAGFGGKVWSASWSGGGSYAWRLRGVLFSPTRFVGVAPGHDDNGPARLSAANQYAVDANKVYVYVPDGSNPQSYYGEMRIIGGNPVFSGFGSMNNLKLIGLRFEGVYGVFYNSLNAAATSPMSLEVAGCEFRKCTRGVGFGNNQPSGTPQEDVFLAHDCYCEDTFGPTFTLNSGGVAGTTISWEVWRNKVVRGNISQGYGGALLYNQATGGARHHAWGNYGYDCRNGVGLTEIDGSFIYGDIYSNKMVVYGNIAERCGVAFQANLSIAYMLVANLAIDCAVMLISTEAGSGSGTAYSAICANNTWLWTGRVDIASIPVGLNIGGTGVQDGSKQEVFQISNQQAGAGGGKMAALTFVNNCAANVSGVDFPNKALFTYASDRSVINNVAGNAAAGLTTGKLIDDKASVDNRTQFFEYVALVADSVGGRSWLRDPLVGSPILAPLSPLIGRGIPMSVTYPDLTGKPFAGLPSIGCLEATPVT